MNIDKDYFFSSIMASLFGGRLNQAQVNGINFKLNAFEKAGIRDNRWKAYMLATSYHETAKTMQPIEEYGKGKGRPYGQKIMYNGKPYKFPDKIYYGRGDVQLTWYENYKLMGKLLNIPLLEQPELALNPEISARIMIEGMTKGRSNRGDFTGVSLETYFNKYRNDPVRARRVVNGLDQANKIAGYYYKFLEAMKI